MKRVAESGAEIQKYLYLSMGDFNDLSRYSTHLDYFYAIP